MKTPLRASTAFALLCSLTLAACSGGGGGGGGGTIIIPSTPTPSPGGPSAALFQCPTSTTSFARASSASERRISPSRARNSASSIDRNTLVVTYADAKSGPIKFDAIGRSARVIHVSASNQAALKASLASTPGVIDVSESHRRSAMTVSTPFVTSDPYFSSTESATVPGQWDMHVEGLESAFGYSQAGNGSGITNANALGSTGVRLAIIDTGMDVTHPDLSGASIVRERCFITDENGIQSTGTFVTDPQGHGTDVTGIAAASVNNGFGFVGDAGNISLMLYRVFPTADDACLNNSPNPPPECGAADTDIASAIDDAVTNGANVISMSLGGTNDSCVNGNDPSTIEGSAVANAIAHNVVVVAAAGNENQTTPDAPGCDPGVISVAASAYNDGQPNGTGYTGANREYVATSYSNVGATLVAPGGDPANNGSDTDNFHWVENIWTSTPYDANYASSCTTDHFNETGDCRAEIAGTSMSTPHVAGAAALVLSVNPSYGTPAAMKTLLCSTADNISDAHQACGRLNVYRAVATALNDPHLP